MKGRMQETILQIAPRGDKKANNWTYLAFKQTLRTIVIFQKVP